MKNLKKKQTNACDYYVLEKNGRFFQDFGEENNFPIICYYPNEAYSFGKRIESAKSFLEEYSDRLKGYKILQVTETVTRTFKYKVYTI